MSILCLFCILLLCYSWKCLRCPFLSSKLLPDFCAFIYIITLHLKCRGTQDSYSSGDHTPGSKPTYQNQKDAERAQLLDALRHSQTRAREAEVAAKNAHDEKDHVVKLLFRQASHLFACKQWLKMLQLENICLQLRLKEHQIAAMFPELPWTVMKEEKVDPEGERKGRAKKKGRRQNKEGGFCKAIMFAVGVGIVGAGLLLGWTFGWLLPRL